MHNLYYSNTPEQLLNTRSNLNVNRKSHCLQVNYDLSGSCCCPLSIFTGRRCSSQFRLQINLEVIQILMLKGGELNMLCIGELMAGKSAFLQHYTGTDHSEEHYKIFARRERTIQKLPIVYLHEIEEKLGVEVYLKSHFDGILFFVRIDDFHNTSRNVLESLAQYSQISGNNVYKIPIKIVVISAKSHSTYDDIGYGEKRRLREEVSNIFEEGQIIYVESDDSYQRELTKFYREILAEEAIGIKETAYSNWMVRDLSTYYSFDQCKLQLFKIYEEFKTLCSYRLKIFSREKKEQEL